MPTLRAKELLKKPERYSDSDFTTRKKEVRFQLSHFERNVENILRNKKYDRSFRDSRDVRTKMRVLRNYINNWEGWNSSVPEFQETLANHLDEELETIQKMWPQIANDVVTDESHFE